MKCLIVAAGLGSRLRSLSESKPLAPVNGVPLIEHVIGRAAAGGASDFVVVTGHRADEVEALLESVQARLGVPIRAVRTPDWSRPNGLSVATGAEAMDSDYLLLMCDHLFDPAIVARLLEAEAGDGVTLAIDRDLANPFTDLEDATRVETAPDGAIVRIGKGLDPYNAIDTGIFRAGPALREAILADTGEGGGGSLTEGVRRLARLGLARTRDIDGLWWLDVDDPPSHALAEAALSCAPPPLRGNAA